MAQNFLNFLSRILIIGEPEQYITYAITLCRVFGYAQGVIMVRYMRYSVFLLLCLVPMAALAAVPLAVEQETVRDVTTIENPEA